MKGDEWFRVNGLWFFQSLRFVKAAEPSAWLMANKNLVKEL